MKICKWLAISSLVIVFGIMSGASYALNPFGSSSSAANNDSRTPAALFTYVDSMTSLNQKLSDAKQAKKPVMIEFFATWCPYCKAVDTNVLSDPKIRQLMSDFVTLRVDISENSLELASMMDRYQVYGVPTMIFYDKQGQQYKARNLDDGITKAGLLSTLKKLA